MTPDPNVSEQVERFYRRLDEQESLRFEAAVERLVAIGPTLGHPTVHTIELIPDYRSLVPLFGKHLKELRIGTIRVLFTFGQDRTPYLLVAGDKHGEWTNWYREAIRRAALEYRDMLDHRDEIR